MYLYVHIPFCLSKCDYCDFFSVPCGSAAHAVGDEYISAVIAEAQYKARLYGIDRWQTIYIGGGTPSLLEPEQLPMLVDALKKCVPDNTVDEITVEMNPETLTKEKLASANQAGVTRLSLGVQSLSDDCLSEVHRHCSARQARTALDDARTYFKGDLNVDVIAGLQSEAHTPCDNKRFFIDTINSLCAYKPEHFSLYTLTLEEGTPLYKRLSGGNKWDCGDADDLWLLGRKMLESSGMEQYEVSNFALRGHESVHNKAYWKQLDYIGCGAGACGTLYSFDGTPGKRATNTTDISSYVSFWNSSASDLKKLPAQMENLSIETEEFEFLMMGLRTKDGVDAGVYRTRFHDVAPWNGDLSARFKGAGREIEDFFDKGYITVYKNRHQENIYTLSPDGILFLNTVLRAFL